MKPYYYLLTLICLLTGSHTFCQPQINLPANLIPVLLRESDDSIKRGHNLWFNPLDNYCDSFQKQTPPYLLNVHLKQIDIQDLQQDYADLVTGKISKETWNRRTQYYTGFSTWFNPKDYLPYLTSQAVKFAFGTNGNDELIMIPDLNNNCNFLDDSAFLLGSLQQGIPKEKIIELQFSGIEWVRKGQVEKIPVPITMQIKQQSFESREEMLSWLEKDNWPSAINRRTAIGSFEAGGEEFVIRFNKNTGGYYFPSIYTEIFFFKKEEIPSYRSYYNKVINKESGGMGDTLLLNHNYLRIHSISEFYDTLFLENLNLSRATGYRTGFFSPPFAAKTLEGRKFNYNGRSPGKYLFIDFWGTWCIPCRELMPEWKKIQLAMKNKPVQFLGVAADKPEDAAKVRKEIAEFKRQGLHVHENRPDFFDRSPSIVNTYKVGCFPTYILLAPNGEILVRGCGKETLAQIAALLKKRFQ